VYRLHSTTYLTDYLQLYSLPNSRNHQKQNISTRFQIMPRALNGMYEILLQRLDSEDDAEKKQMRERILTLMAVSFRPISVVEMHYVWVTDEGEECFDADQKTFPSLNEMIDACGSLVDTYPVKSLNDRVTDSVECFRFTHATVKEFLTTRNHALEKQSVFVPLDLVAAHTSVATVCSMYSLIMRRFSYSWIKYSHSACFRDHFESNYRSEL
jgi:hypothetical protein